MSILNSNYVLEPAPQEPISPEATVPKDTKRWLDGVPVIRVSAALSVTIISVPRFGLPRSRFLCAPHQRDTWHSVRIWFRPVLVAAMRFSIRHPSRGVRGDCCCHHHHCDPPLMLNFSIMQNWWR